MSDDVESSVEKQIREAMARGDFDNLPGKGKPLKLDDDGLVPEDLRLAYHMLQSNGFAPEWIELGQEIETERARLEEALLEGTREERRRRFHALREPIEGLNRKILDYNLRVPLPNLQKRRVRIPPDLAAE